MRRDFQPQTGLTGITEMMVPIDGQLSNVLGAAMSAQAHSLRAHPQPVLSRLWDVISGISEPISGKNLLAKAVSGGDLNDDEKATLLSTGRSLVGDQIDYPDHRETWYEMLAKFCPSFSASNYAWSVLWPIPQRQLMISLPWSSRVRPLSTLVESPCSPASKEMAGWCFTRDIAALGVHLVPEELSQEKGFTQKPKWLEEKAVLIPLGRNFGAYGMLLYFQLARLQLEFIEPARLMFASHPAAQGIRNFQVANSAYTEALEFVRSEIPLSPQLSFIGSAWRKQLSAQTQDGLQMAMLVPHYNGDPTGAILKQRSSETKSGIVSMEALRKMANEIVRSYYTPNNMIPRWGTADPVDVFTLRQWIAELSPFMTQVKSMATNFQYTPIDATPTTINLTGADYSLSDMDGWEGSLVNAVLGYTPMIGIQNRKVLGKEKRNTDNFGISGTGDAITPGIPTYYVPLPGAPVADSHADGLRRRYLPASATAEATNATSQFISGSTVAMHSMVVDLWKNGKQPTIRQYYYDPYSAREWGTPTDKPAPATNAVQTTSWDPYVYGTPATIADAVAGAYPAHELDHVMHRPEGFNIRVPMRVARSYAAQILDKELLVIARTYTQEGYVSFTDDELNFGTEGAAAVSLLVTLVPNKQSVYERAASKRVDSGD